VPPFQAERAAGMSAEARRQEAERHLRRDPPDFAQAHKWYMQAMMLGMTKAEAQLRGGHRGQRILLAEDNLMNQDVARALLNRVGLHVDIASNGLEAVQRAEAGGYDLILMDIQMPELDGLEATRLLRRQPALANLPIIAMSANAFAEDRKKSMDSGMNAHLGTPVDPAELDRTLLRWLPAGESALPSEPDSEPTPPSAPPTTASIDWDAIRTTLDQLEVMLIELNMSSNELWHQEKAALQAALGHYGRRMEAQIDVFAYDKALETLIQARAELPELHETKAGGQVA
jgi:CheY-like chemotaxis protein